MNKKYIGSTLILLTFSLLLYIPLSAQKSAQVKELKGFNKFIVQQMEEWEVPGCAVAIVKDGKVIFSEGFGIRDIQKGLKVTPQTLFAIASCTKAFTATAIGILADEEKIDWDTPVQDYVPTFRLHDPCATQHMTVRDPLCHRSGLARHDAMWYGSSYTMKDIFDRIQHLEPNLDFRSAWQYSNITYSVVGYLIEQITGKPWEEFVREKIFHPLGMNSSNFSFQETKTFPDFALPYASREGEVKELPFRDLANIGPAGSINSNLIDMTQWLLFNLQKGKSKEQQILSEATLSLIHSPQMVMPGPVQYDELLHSCYGMGWAITPYRGHLMVHHGGGIDGFASYVCLLPRDNIGLVVLVNLEGSPLVQIVGYNALDRLLGLNQAPWSERLRDQMKQYREMQEKSQEGALSDRKTGTRPSHPLQDYAADYEHPGYGVLSIRLEGEQLMANLNGIELPLKHYHYDTFEIGDIRYIVPLKGRKLSFFLDKKGDIDKVTVPLEPQVKDIVFNRVPEKSLKERSFLEKFTGEYEVSGMAFSVVLRGESTLVMTILGQPEYELIPSKGTEFQVKNLSGFSIRFQLSPEGEVSQAVITMPNGVFTAKKK